MSKTVSDYQMNFNMPPGHAHTSMYSYYNKFHHHSFIFTFECLWLEYIFHGIVPTHQRFKISKQLFFNENNAQELFEIPAQTK